MHQNDQIPQNLTLILRNITDNDHFRKFLKKFVEKINFETKNILNLTPERVETLYKNLRNKLNAIRQTTSIQPLIQSSTWLENELRVFIFIVCGHLFLTKKSLLQMKDQDYGFLHRIFPTKLPQHLQYQIKLLFSNKNIKWIVEESRLFQQIMRQNTQLKKWNFIAKEMYLKSNRRFFKTPKQCRQRWINHIDPNKIKGNWTENEDQILLTTIQQVGKKWTLIARQLQEKRTQNSVKNRYNSLIKSAKKRLGFDLTEQKLLNLLMKKISPQDQSQKTKALSKSQNQNNIKSLQTKIQKNQLQLPLTLNMQKQCQTGKQSKMCTQQSLQSKKSLMIPQLSSGLEFKYIFQQSQQIQNMSWQGSSNLDHFVQKYYVDGGNFCFLDDNPI